MGEKGKMKVDINELFEMISWNSSEEKQRQGIEEGKKVKYLSVLFQPVEDKSVWENCAKIICERSDQELDSYLFEMFEWLQDMNWPGFFIIYNRLKEMSPRCIKPGYSYSIKMALLTQDESWLCYLSGLIENQELYELLSQEYQILMKEKYEQFWK